MHLGAGEERARSVRRVPGIRRERDVARVEQHERHVADSLLAAQRGDDLRGWVELDAEAVAVEGGGRGAELVGTVVGRVLVRGRVSRGVGEGSDHRRRRRQVGVADAEADHVHALASLSRDLALELGEQVGRDLIEALRKSHGVTFRGHAHRPASSDGRTSEARACWSRHRRRRLTARTPRTARRCRSPRPARSASPARPPARRGDRRRRGGR